MDWNLHPTVHTFGYLIMQLLCRKCTIFSSPNRYYEVVLVPAPTSDLINGRRPSAHIFHFWRIISYPILRLSCYDILPFMRICSLQLYNVKLKTSGAMWEHLLESCWICTISDKPCVYELPIQVKSQCPILTTTISRGGASFGGTLFI